MGYSFSYRAMDLSGEIEELDPYEAFVTYYRATRILLRLDKAAEALPAAQRAVELAELLDEPPLRADALNVLALVQRALGDRNASTALLTAAELPLRADESALSMAFIRANLAEHYAERKDYDRFSRYEQEARALFTRAEQLREYYLLDPIPEAYYQRGDYATGLTRLDESLTFLTAHSPYRLTVDSLDPTARDIVPLATLTALDRRPAALQAYRLLFAVQDLLREGVTDYASRSYYSRNLRPHFDRAIALYYAAYHDTKGSTALWQAFALSERARAYSLLAVLQSGQARTSEETRLLDQIAELERAQSLGTDTGDELSTARLTLERLYFRQREQLPTPAVALALHAAQSDLLSGEYAHPSYWSGLMLHGMGDPLDLPVATSDRIMPWWGWVLTALLVAGVLAYFFKFLYQARPVPPEKEGA